MGGNVGVVAHVTPEEIGQAQEGPDHLGVRGRLPMPGHFDLSGGHVNVALSDPKAYDVSGAGAQL